MSTEAYLFAGPNGVGKSTIINAVIEQLPHEFIHVQGSKVLKDALGVESYEDLAKFDKAYKNAVAEIAMTSLVRKAREDRIPSTLLIDAHMLFFDKGTVTSSVTDWYKEVDGIVSVISDPAKAYARIVSDAESGIRKRSILPIEVENDASIAISMLAGYMEMSRQYARMFSKEHSIPLLELNNASTPLAASADFLEFIHFRNKTSISD